MYLSMPWCIGDIHPCLSIKRVIHKLEKLTWAVVQSAFFKPMRVNILLLDENSSSLTTISFHLDSTMIERFLYGSSSE